MCRKVHGRRVSNAWGIYLLVGNNAPKGVVIPHETVGWDAYGETRGPQGLGLEEDPASD
jgi:hypothetical protein